MVNLTFLPEAWEDYLYWQGQDKRTLKKINGLKSCCIGDIRMNL